MTTAASSKSAPTSDKPRKYGVSARLATPTHVKWLRDKTLIREFEIRTMQAYSNAQIGGFCHVYNGQEAVAVATINSVNPDDPVITAYRDHGHALARGMHPNACMAEMFGKVTGCAKGKGGSMHMFDRPNHLYGGHGIVGAQTPLGAGLAFAARYENEVLKKGEKRVCLCYLGDGALNQGALHEAMNLAGLWSLPVIYIVENNGYSMGTSIARGTTMAHNLMAKPAAYGIEGLTIREGLDAMLIYDQFKPYADELREKQRPGCVDLQTYRYQGHSMSDPQKYRTREEVQSYQDRDCIERLLAYVKGERGYTDEQHKAMLSEVREEVRASVKFAEDSPAPDPEKELYSDVFISPLKNSSPLGDYVRGETNHLLRGQ